MLNDALLVLPEARTGLAALTAWWYGTGDVPDTLLARRAAT
jgi:hypothetical protein